MRTWLRAGCLAGLAAAGGCGGGKQVPPVAVDAAAEAADEKAQRDEAEREERQLKAEGKQAEPDD
jgi:hypothetical protein